MNEIVCLLGIIMWHKMPHKAIVARMLRTIREVNNLGLFKTQLIYVLLDSTAMHSFISVKQVETTGLVPTIEPFSSL